MCQEVGFVYNVHRQGESYDTRLGDTVISEGGVKRKKCQLSVNEAPLELKRVLSD